MSRAIACVSALRSAAVMRRERRPSALIVVVVIRAPQWHMLGGQRPPVALTLTRSCGFGVVAAAPAAQVARATRPTTRMRMRGTICVVYVADAPFVTRAIQPVAA